MAGFVKAQNFNRVVYTASGAANTVGINPVSGAVTWGGTVPPEAYRTLGHAIKTATAVYPFIGVDEVEAGVGVSGAVNFTRSVKTTTQSSLIFYGD